MLSILNIGEKQKMKNTVHLLPNALRLLWNQTVEQRQKGRVTKLQRALKVHLTLESILNTWKSHGCWFMTQDVLEDFL